MTSRSTAPRSAPTLCINGALAQIDVNCNAVTGATSSGLVARWAMYEGSGTVAKNSTEAGSAIDAALVGGVNWVSDGPTLECGRHSVIEADRWPGVSPDDSEVPG